MATLRQSRTLRGRRSRPRPITRSTRRSTVTSALAHVLAHAVGSNEINVTIWGATAASPTGLATSRTYTTVSALLDELVNARVWIGFHFRSSVVVGEDLGTSVANWELQRYFQPTSDHDG
jgi:hypothetical protein